MHVNQYSITRVHVLVHCVRVKLHSSFCSGYFVEYFFGLNWKGRIYLQIRLVLCSQWHFMLGPPADNVRRYYTHVLNMYVLYTYSSWIYDSEDISFAFSGQRLSSVSCNQISWSNVFLLCFSTLDNSNNVSLRPASRQFIQRDVGCQIDGHFQVRFQNKQPRSWRSSVDSDILDYW